MSISYIESPSTNWKIKQTLGEGAKIYPFPVDFMLSPQSPAPKTSAVRTEIKRLVQKLQVDNIERVRAIAPNAPNLHIIDFELKLQPEAELSEEAWDKIQDLVIDLEWQLRDDTQEEWYFYPEIVEDFAKVVDGGEIVADTGEQCIERRMTFSALKTQISHFSVS